MTAARINRGGNRAVFVGMALPALALLPLNHLDWRFDRDAILAGEWWRLVTGQWLHLGPGHLLLNLVGLGLIAFVVGRALPWLGWIIVLVISVLSVAVGLLVLHPDVTAYMGLSGALHGLLAAGALVLLFAPQGGSAKRSDRLEGGVLLALVLAKVVVESVFDRSAGSEVIVGGEIIYEAHALGILGGVLGSMVWLLAGLNTARHLNR